MRNKLLLATMALPFIMGACSQEDALTEIQGNDQYANIAKVDAIFSIDNAATTRLTQSWGIQDGDVLGFAWLGDDDNVGIDGKAYQNHPLTASGKYFQPATSIYVGKYFTYHPYDYQTVGVGEINFTVANQELTTNSNAIAKNSIWISPKWTDVTVAGSDGLDVAGVDKTFNMYPKKFSNLAQLVLTYVNNKYEHDLPSPTISKIEVSYDATDLGTATSVNAFTYAPSTELYSGTSDMLTELYWNDKTFATTSLGATPVTGAVTLTGEYLADNDANEATTFYYNALPSTGTVTANSSVTIKITHTYGVLTIEKKLSEIAKTYDNTILPNGGYHTDFDGTTGLAADAVAANQSFVQTLGKNGKFITEADFVESVMNGMCVDDKDHLNSLLKYYLYYKKPTNREVVVLYLDADSNNEFILSKENIDLLHQINDDQTTPLVTVKACSTHNNPKLVLSNVGDAEASELPNLYNCISGSTWMTLRGNWNWTSGPKLMTGVSQLTNEGTINFDNCAISTNNNATFINNGTINVTGLVKQQIAMTNNGTINIGAEGVSAEYRADGTNGVITNQSSTTEEMGEIFNYGIFATSNSGKIMNYGYIENMVGGTANMTYITENQTSGAKFDARYDKTSNKYGTIVLKDANDNISVSNATSTGFIKYTYPADAPAAYATPDVCKYNYLIVDNRDIDFTGTGLKGEFAHIKFLEIRSKDTNIPVITQPDNIGGSRLNSLQGFIVKGKANVKENNRLVAEAAYIEGTFYYGGLFCISGNTNVVPSTQNTYFGNSSADCLVKY